MHETPEEAPDFIPEAEVIEALKRGHKGSAEQHREGIELANRWAEQERAKLSPTSSLKERLKLTQRVAHLYTSSGYRGTAIDFLNAAIRDLRNIGTEEAIDLVRVVEVQLKDIRELGPTMDRIKKFEEGELQPRILQRKTEIDSGEPEIGIAKQLENPN